MMSTTSETAESPNALPAPLSAPTRIKPTRMLMASPAAAKASNVRAANGARSSANTAAWLVAGRNALISPRTITSISGG